MLWKTTGLNSSFTPIYSGRSFKPFTLTGGLNNLNLGEPLSNNSFCPSYPKWDSVTITAPSISNQSLIYNPDALSFPA